MDPRNTSLLHTETKFSSRTPCTRLTLDCEILDRFAYDRIEAFKKSIWELQSLAPLHNYGVNLVYILLLLENTLQPYANREVQSRLVTPKSARYNTRASIADLEAEDNFEQAVGNLYKQNPIQFYSSNSIIEAELKKLNSQPIHSTPALVLASAALTTPVAAQQVLSSPPLSQASHLFSQVVSFSQPSVVTAATSAVQTSKPSSSA